MGGKTKIKDMDKNKNINIRIELSERFFKKLNIDPNTSYLMDVKKAIFAFYRLSSPDLSIKTPKKTLAEQRPNNAYGIPINDHELRIFMDLFHLTGDDWFQESIGGRITEEILTADYIKNKL